ncbi:MAG TPA: extracellular solute-binding protein [bacterium]|nr:extracellular solute-binding protein [bacterium]
MRRHGLVRCRLAVAVVIGLALALGGGAWTPAAIGASAWSLPTHPVTVTYWDSAEAVKNDLVSKILIPEYEKLHPNVTIKYEIVSDLQSKLLVALSTGTASDMFSVPDWFLPKYLQTHVLDALPPAAWGQSNVTGVMSAYLPHMLDAMLDQGKLYGVPAQENAHSLYMNNRLLRDAGLDPMKDAPKTWDDVARLNKVLTKSQNGQVVQKGWEMRYINDDGHWQAQMFQILLYQAGGEVTRNGRPVFNSAAGVKALETWKGVTVAPQITQNTSGSPYQDFATEHDAMTFAGPNAGASIEKINPQMAGNYSVAPLPQIRPDHPATIIYSFDWGVNAKAPEDERAVAWDFIHYMGTRPAQWMAAARYLQPVKGWYDAPEAKQVPFLSVFVHDLSIGKPLARTANYPELQSSLVRMIERVILNGGDPKQALDQAAEEYVRAAK